MYVQVYVSLYLQYKIKFWNNVIFSSQSSKTLHKHSELNFDEITCT